MTINKDDAALLASLRKHEGVREKPYLDTEGHLTIAVGRNLDAKGVRPDEIRLMLTNDAADAIADAKALCPTFDALTANRQRALAEMAFNLGRDRLAGFRKMWAAIAAWDFKAAAAEALDSKWAKQVGQRARTLADMIEKG